MKKILLSLLALLMVSTAFADDFKITSSDPADGSEVAGIAKGDYWKFATNMDEDASFVGARYEFKDETTGNVLYQGDLAKASKYDATAKTWSVKNYSTSLSDFKKGHTIKLTISAYDNVNISQGQCLGSDFVTFTGAGSADYEYSAAQLVSISPVEGTELLSADDNTFVLTFSGAVRLDKTRTNIITGQMATDDFTSITASEDSTVWTLVARQSTIESATPALQFNVYGTDLNGLTLEGNNKGAYRLEEKSYYKFKYDCLLGSPAMTIEPAAGVVTSLKDFKVSYSGGMERSWTKNTAITITDATGETVATLPLDDYVNIVDNEYAEFSLPEAIETPGKYTLNIPSGIFSLGTEFEGYTSKEQTVNYIIEGEELTAVITPAEGTEWAAMPNITVTFSNTEAVGYANYVITDKNAADPDQAVIMSGDLKKQSDGTWATKYLAMYEIALYAGHTYEISVKAYATENDYNYGNEPMAVFTSDIKGTTEAYQYADITLVSVDPENYSTITSGTITATFSAAVETLTAEIVGNNCICTTVANDDKTVWTITIPETVMNTATGSINVDVYAKDADGKVVQGNAGENAESLFQWTYYCYNGAPEFTVSPEDGATLTQIDVIKCSYAGKINPNFAWDPMIITKDGVEVCRVNSYDSGKLVSNNDNTEVTITLAEPITEEGTYVVTFPATFFALGEEFEGCSSKEQKVTYTVGAVNGLSELNVEGLKQNVNGVYNLNGQLVGRIENGKLRIENSKGIHIVNGKKVVIK